MHGFGIWNAAGIRAVKSQRRGRRIRLLTSNYTLQNQENLSKLQGLNQSFGMAQRMRYRKELYVSRYYLSRLERITLFEVDQVLVNYQRVRDLLQEAYGESVDCRIIPYCSEFAFTETRGTSEIPQLRDLKFKAERPLIVSVSRHDPRKGLDVLISALAKVKNQGIDFTAVLLGGGDLLEKNRLLAVELGVADRVAIAGCVDLGGRRISETKIFLLPSI